MTSQGFVISNNTELPDRLQCLRGKLVDIVKDLGWELSVVLRTDESSKKFQTIPLRWIVERTFSWIENYRRMTTDYEYKAESAEAMLQITFCQIMLRKLMK